MSERPQSAPVEVPPHTAFARSTDVGALGGELKRRASHRSRVRRQAPDQPERHSLGSASWLEQAFVLELPQQPRELAAERALVNRVLARQARDDLLGRQRCAEQFPDASRGLVQLEDSAGAKIHQDASALPCALATTSARGRLGVSGEVTSAMISIQLS